MTLWIVHDQESEFPREEFDYMLRRAHNIEQWAWDEALRICYDDGQSPHTRTALALQAAYRRAQKHAEVIAETLSAEEQAMGLYRSSGACAEIARRIRHREGVGGSKASGPAQRPDACAPPADLVAMINNLLRYRIDHEYHCATTHGKPELSCDCGLAPLLVAIDAAIAEINQSDRESDNLEI